MTESALETISTDMVIQTIATSAPTIQPDAGVSVLESLQTSALETVSTDMVLESSPGTVVSGGASDLTYPAVVTLSGHRAVIYSPASGGWIYADRTIPSHAGAQIAVTTGAIIAGASGPARISGVMDEPSWSWPAPCPLYLDTAGQLTAAPPTSGFLREVARAVTAQRIVIEPEPAIILA